MTRSVRIGASAGFAGDRFAPAVDLATHGRLDYLVFECVAERTIARAQAARLRGPSAGYDPLLETRMRAVLPSAKRAGTRIVANMGAANPTGAARAIAATAADLGLSDLRIAVVDGDDVLPLVRAAPLPLSDLALTTAELGGGLVSANAFLGCRAIVAALDAGADVVVTGRVGDPALFLAPLVHEFGWAEDDWTRLGRGTLVGHLLECAGQLTDGHFADPGVNDVPDLAWRGFPFADVQEDGSAVLGKLDRTGGMLTVATCKEQLLYEVADPAAYLQADVSADFSGVRLAQLAPDRVRVTGGDGRPAPAELKISVAYDGFVGEGQRGAGGRVRDDRLRDRADTCPRGELPVILRDLARTRTGDKGDTLQIAVIADAPENYIHLVATMPAERVLKHLPGLPTDIMAKRHELPGLHALLFVLEGALTGGMTRSLPLDAQDKTIGMQLLDMNVGSPR